nr:reductive dehalogenase [uncultured prokaryote]
MPKPNKNLSRKDFLKAAGVSVFSLLLSGTKPPDPPNINPVLSFADEAGRPQRPWWVKRVPKPTMEVDWSKMSRFDARDAVLGDGGNLADFIGETQAQAALDHRERLEKERIQSAMPGFTLKDHVLRDAQALNVADNSSLLGPPIPTPKERGVEKFQGTPEEAARIIRVAMRSFGAAQVGFVELDENTRKLIYAVDPDGKEIAFEVLDRARETDQKRIIPHQAKWVIAYTVRMSIENMRHAPSMISTQDSYSGYSRGRYIQKHTQAFLTGLGYQGIGQVPLNGLGITPAFSVLAGHGEMSRLNRMITPEYGPMVRTFMMITDLPVATDQPIDAGIMEFCKACKKCSESCPASALSRTDDPDWEGRGSWNNPGHQAYFEDAAKCLRYWFEESGSDCSICFSVCPFSKKDRAWVHSLAKASIAKIPHLDGMFRSLDDALSYGAQKNMKEWWHLDLPEHGLDPEQWKS